MFLLFGDELLSLVFDRPLQLVERLLEIAHLFAYGLDSERVELFQSLEILRTEELGELALQTFDLVLLFGDGLETFSLHLGGLLPSSFGLRLESDPPCFGLDQISRIVESVESDEPSNLVAQVRVAGREFSDSVAYVADELFGLVECVLSDEVGDVIAHDRSAPEFAVEFLRLSLQERERLSRSSSRASLSADDGAEICRVDLARCFSNLPPKTVNSRKSKPIPTQNSRRASNR